MAFASKNQTGPMADINVTPLVDVMLVLLIIFMIVVPQLTHKIQIDLPQKSNVIPKVDPPPPVRLTVLPSGDIFWNDAPLFREALEPQLRIEAKKDPQPMLEIKADPNTEYQIVAEILATAKNAHVKKIGFVQ